MGGAACAPSDANELFVGTDSDASTAADEDAAADHDDAKCDEGEQKSCSCSTTEYGTQTCSSGEFGACGDCQPVDTAPRCVAGTYKAHFNGMYQSAASSFWGLTPGVDDVVSFDPEFQLMRDGDGEFYLVQGGCFPWADQEKWAGGEDTAYGHTFEMSGAVDCNTGVVDFDFRLSFISKDASQFGAGWSRFFSQGKLTGRYDPKSRSFVDGKWDLHEPKQAFASKPGGGKGTFQATLSEESQTVAEPKACFDVPFPKDLTPQSVPAPG